MQSGGWKASPSTISIGRLRLSVSLIVRRPTYLLPAIDFPTSPLAY
ncbi:MAG: hypothetical protein ACTS41_01840 [Candidatus Hodgkinia cicadicola]